MNVILNEVIAVRVPVSLKEKLVYFSEQEEVRVSSVIRLAILSYLKQESPELFHKRPSAWSIAS